MPLGYYDEEGYWHRPPQDEERAPPPRKSKRPIRDPYYDNYRGREDQYDPYGRRVNIRRTTTFGNQPVRRVRTSEMGMFSIEEIKDLVISTLVLAVAFTLVMGYPRHFTDPFSVFVDHFPLSLLATGTAFTIHELAHKFMAQKHGLPAEFVLNPTGIMIALATAAMIGFLFALPGAVVFSGAGADRRIVGKVGAAGPVVNIVLAVLFLPLMLFVYAPLSIVVFVNVFLAGFNMLPFGPFDGRKVWRWSPALFVLLFLIIIVLGVVSFFPGLLLGLF